MIDTKGGRSKALHNHLPTLNYHIKTIHCHKQLSGWLFEEVGKVGMVLFEQK